MLTGIDATSPKLLNRSEPQNEFLARLLAGLRRLASRSRPAPSVNDLNDRALADLNLRRWDVEYPDPRAPRLY